MAETAAPYAKAYAAFRLERVEAKLSGSLKGGLNACVECCDLRVRWRLSAHAHPRDIAFVEQLPKTPSGKIQSFLLRNAEKAAAHDAAQSH